MVLLLIIEEGRGCKRMEEDGRGGKRRREEDVRGGKRRLEETGGD